MKWTRSLTLIVCLVASTLPVTAQEQTERASPLARAITIEAVRLAAAGETTSSSVDAVQPGGGKSARSDWSRVFNVAPGTEVIVTVRGSQPGARYVVLADESGLTVLNLTDPTLPAVARDVLLFAAAHHPEYFAAAQKGGQFVLDKDVRVGPDGVFVADRKVADLGQVVENIARTDVAEIKAGGAPTGRKRLGPWAALPGALAGGMIGGAVGQGAAGRGLGGAFVGMLAGAVVSVFAPRKVAGGFLGVGGGFVAGALTGAAIEGDCRADHPCDKGVIVGAPLGAIAGGVLGYRMSRHQTESVIYHAP